MTLVQALEVLDHTDFGDSNLEPEVLQALAIVVNSARTRARGLELDDATKRVVETATD